MSDEILQKAISKINSKNDDDFVDRLNYRLTAVIFGLFSAVVFLKQLFGTSIACFEPAEFVDSWKTYAINYCFARNTYFVNMTERFPPREERSDRELHYYQYVPFILAVQVCLFLLPKVLCASMNLKTGLVVHKITTTDGGEFDSKKAEENGENLFRFLVAQNCGLSGMRIGSVGQIAAFLHRSSITRGYLLFKIANTLNAILQLWLINHFMAPNTPSGIWGLDFVRGWMDNHAWRQTGHFPRVTFCDIEVRELAVKPVVYTVQCVLMINLLNEKIFLFVWFWLLMMSILNVFNLLQWLYNTQFESRRIEFIKDKLQHLKNRKEIELRERHVHEFVSDFLFIDGVTALRIAEVNSGELASSIMTTAIWESFLLQREYKEKHVEETGKIPDADTSQFLVDVQNIFKLA